jgi:hypothetical protein
MFGDWDWIPSRTGAQEARFEQWLQEVSGDRLVIVEIGAGSAVPTVRYTSERVVQALGGTLIRINPREPEVPRGQIGIGAPALETLRTMAAELAASG